MKRFTLTACFSILSSLIASFCLGEWYHLQAAGMLFDVPAGWTARADGKQFLIHSPDESIAAVFWIPEAIEWEAAVEGIFEEIAKVVEDPIVEDEIIEDQVNGMPYVEAAGEGVVEGVEIEWSLALIMADRPVIALTFAEPDDWEHYEEAVESLFDSFRRYDRAQ